MALPLAVHSASAPARVVTADTVTTFVNIRADRSVASSIIGELGPGMSFLLISEDARWYEIELPDGGTGYVNRHWTEKTDSIIDPLPEQVYANQVPLAESLPQNEPVSEAEVRTALSTATVASAAPPPDRARDKDQRDRSVLTEATALLQRDRAKDAYALLSGIESQWAGDSGFDYLYGVAALGSGDAVEAIFALDRVTRSLPELITARLELARALYIDGDRERAVQEFTTLLEQQLSAEVRGIVQGYLDALNEPLQSRNRPRKLVYAGAMGGYDTNANGAADLTSFFGFTLDPRNTETDSVFVEAQFGYLTRRPLRPSVELSWQNEIKHRHNPSASFVDSSFATSVLALGFRRGANNFIAGVGAYWSALDGRFNERSAALDLGWQRSLHENALRLGLRAGPVQFYDEQSIRDISRVLYTLTFRQPLQDGNGELNWVAIGGRDLATDSLSPYSNTRMGGRIDARFKLAGNDMHADVGYLSIPYNGNRNFFGIKRDDGQFISTISMELRDKPFNGWTFIPSLRYVNNDSTVAIFDYDRFEMGFLFRVSR